MDGSDVNEYSRKIHDTQGFDNESNKETNVDVVQVTALLEYIDISHTCFVLVSNLEQKICVKLLIYLLWCECLVIYVCLQPYILRIYIYIYIYIHSIRHSLLALILLLTRLGTFEGLITFEELINLQKLCNHHGYFSITHNVETLN